jgi:hypothetical protein
MFHRSLLAGTLATALAIALAPVPVRADGDKRDCDVPLANWKPRAAVEEALKARGLTLQSIRSDDGCYKVKVVTDTGEKRRLMLDPETLEPVGEAD